MTSAMHTFLNAPQVASTAPDSTASRRNRRGASIWGRNRPARSMGPATSWGKKVTYTA